MLKYSIGTRVKAIIQDNVFIGMVVKNDLQSPYSYRIKLDIKLPINHLFTETGTGLLIANENELILDFLLIEDGPITYAI